MKMLFSVMMVLLALVSQAQITKVSLQASGLTCSMCSKAVKNALEKVPFVNNVAVDIKSQEYILSFKEGSKVEPDQLTKAVQDAGFSVASLKVWAIVPEVKLEKDQHIKIGDQNFHFLNAASQTINGTVSFSIVDKGFISDKAYKKYVAMSKMPCVKTGRMEQCCASAAVAANSRVYHVII